MTEEIIIDKEEFWDMFEQHPINAVEGLFDKIEMLVNLIQRLEQENERLKKNDCEKCKHLDLYMKYKSALEEIRKQCKCYGRQTGSNREFDREYGGELHINIIEEINEVLDE